MDQKIQHSKNINSPQTDLKTLTKYKSEFQHISCRYKYQDSKLTWKDKGTRISQLKKNKMSSQGNIFISYNLRVIKIRWDWQRTDILNSGTKLRMQKQTDNSILLNKILEKVKHKGEMIFLKKWYWNNQKSLCKFYEPLPGSHTLIQNE